MEWASILNIFWFFKAYQECFEASRSNDCFLYHSCNCHFHRTSHWNSRVQSRKKYENDWKALFTIFYSRQDLPALFTILLMNHTFDFYFFKAYCEHFEASSPNDCFLHHSYNCHFHRTSRWNSRVLHSCSSKYCHHQDCISNNWWNISTKNWNSIKEY